MSERPWWTFQERGSRLGMRLVLWLLNFCGYRVASVAVFPIAAYFFGTGRASRRASMEYLRRLHAHCPAAPGPTLWNSFRHHLEFALTILDRAWFWQGKLEKFQISTTGRELLRQYRGRGVLLVGAHLGSFDALRVLAGVENLKLRVVMNRGQARKINALFRALSRGSDLNVVELAPGDIDGVLALRQAVEEGEMIAILGDRVVETSPGRTVKVPFLGSEAAFPENPWILAALLECPVMLTFGLRVGRLRYHLRAELFSDRIVVDRTRRREEIIARVNRFARRLEDLCCDHPFQWFNFHDIWDAHD